MLRPCARTVTDSSNNMSTATMVLILVLVVKGVFICFALMAVCYRCVQRTAVPSHPKAKP